MFGLNMNKGVKEMNKAFGYFIIMMIGAIGTLPLAVDYHLGHCFTWFGVITFLVSMWFIGVLSVINAQKR